MIFFSIFALLFIAYTLWTLSNLISNYLKARKTNLPILISPISPIHPIWALFHETLVPLFTSLPFNLGSFANYSYIGWPYHDKCDLHAKYGDAVVIVFTSHIDVCIANGEAIDDVTSHRKDFIKPTKFYKPLEVFGPNVDTVEGADWQRHRKITTPPFNERNSSLVWKESLRQADAMVSSWVEEGERGSDGTAEDTLTLALHVLTSAGFGMAFDFHTAASGKGGLEHGHELSYRDALGAVLRDIVPVFIVPQWLFAIPFLPKRLQSLGKAVTEFKAYMTEMVAKERAMIAKRDPGTGNLMSSLVRASDQASGNALTDEEILGNIFIYNLAGHETTANTLAYTIMLLAAYPAYQSWLAEELDRVFGLDQEVIPNTAAAYEELFPKLKRCLATMFETLRLWSPTTSLPKYTNDTPQTLTINGTQHILPAHTYLSLNQSAVHSLPKYWGANSLQWLPDRWMASRSSGDGHETIKDPPGGRGTFIPWAEGARICPGKKFAQVEFVAVLATLFRRWTVRPATLKGESPQEARRRALGVVEDSGVIVTLQMRKPKTVKLVWNRRD